MSFALGRPDTLGMDEYHNRRFPEASPETAIISCMTGLGKITRKVTLEVYHSKATARQKYSIALEIERDLDAWLTSLPTMIRPETPAGSKFASLRDPKWARRQRLVLQIRKLTFITQSHLCSFSKQASTTLRCFFSVPFSTLLREK